MRTLRLTQTSEGGGRYRIQVRYEGDGLAPVEVFGSFSFTLTAQDLEDLRWYLEDYAEFPYDPAPIIATRVEHQIAEIGKALFDAVFRSSDDARDLWATLRTDLSDTRIEVASEVGAPGIPWELLRDPVTDVPLALRARSFVRIVHSPAQRPRLPSQTDGPVRILLVISRPSGGEDVPFRSVASRLIAALGTTPDQYQLDVLRPATFTRLSQVLREAHLRGEPYQVVHFDGHGTYLRYHPQDGAASLIYGTPRHGSHGYLVFEDPTTPDGVEMIDGPTLGTLLAETQVPVLVLNACRSAHAGPLGQPLPAPEGGPEDPHAQVRAYGSLAQEVMDAGVAGVVAMRYNVYVVTAAQFVADLYAALRQSRPLGEAVSLGRKQLDANPVREIAGKRVELQDWPVPVVYEAAPIQLFPANGPTPTLRIMLQAPYTMPSRGVLDPQLPYSPDAGFFGRDETLLALDRRFDTQRVVLLHGNAGSGKTATAAEFARWYALTGGVIGPVLFTSFERPRPLARVLDDLEPFFRPMLEQHGIEWLTLNETDRRDVALQLLRQVPVLWIWDNVEEVAGFPNLTIGALSREEQQEFADFLRAARDSEAKFLLTSRRDERQWLGDLPSRILLPPMPLYERIEFARSLAEKRGRPITDVPAWLPLLRYTEGNPLTLTVVVGQALRDGMTTLEEINVFVDKLRTGAAELNDDEAEGRTRSLVASLNYGFEHAFTDVEREMLSQLRFFQTIVNIDILHPAIIPEHQQTWNLDCVNTPADKISKETLTQLCVRAADIGLLTQINDKIFLMHPAIPWFLRKLASGALTGDAGDNHDSDSRVQVEPLNACAARAYVEAVGGLGGSLGEELNKGNQAIGRALRAEEANLRYALDLAKAFGWWPSVIGPMIGLGALFEFTGRSSEWKKLVEEIIPEFVDLQNDGPLPGREEHWTFVTSWRIELARSERDWDEAKRLLTLLLEQERERCAPLLSQTPSGLTPAQVLDIANLALHEIDLGIVLGELNSPEGVPQFDRAMELSTWIGDTEGQAHARFNKGGAYATVEAIRDFEVADQCYQEASGLAKETNRHFRGRCLGQRGYIALERFKAGLNSNGPDRQLLANAISFYEEGLQLLGDDSPISDRLTFENQLCNCFNHASRSDLAIPHCREAVRLAESSGDGIRAAGARGNMARALAQDGMLESGLSYAKAARKSFELYLGADSEKARIAQGMIDQILERLDGSTDRI